MPGEKPVHQFRGVYGGKEKKCVVMGENARVFVSAEKGMSERDAYMVNFTTYSFWRVFFMLC